MLLFPLKCLYWFWPQTFESMVKIELLKNIPSSNWVNGVCGVYAGDMGPKPEPGVSGFPCIGLGVCMGE